MSDAYKAEAPAEHSGGEAKAVFTGGSALQAREPRSWKPLAIAGGVILVIVAVLLVLGERSRQAANPGGAGLAPAAAYASSLPISSVQMSDSSNLSGGKETYIDGIITNKGAQTVRAVTVQIAFKDFTGQLAGKETLPLTLVRFREPYVDTEPVASDPIQPGNARPFRLIFDAAPASWDGAYPEIRVIAVEAR